MAKKESENGSLALYRKYRPQSFEGIHGDREIVEVLKAAIANNKLAHAYLFAGSRGTGKTTVARIFAHALGTTEKDIYEIDAASNRQVEDARELREGVSTLPFDSKYKFYILDEVHMFTKDAWNTLLKTLEEPPEHAMFVLATTELDRVPDTIQSRCQLFRFKKPTQEILKSLLVEVAKKEGSKLEPAGAELIAMMAEGSFRDALGTLQKVMTASKDAKLSEEEVAKVVGAPTGKTINAFLSALAKKDMGAALESFHTALSGGSEAKVFALLIIAKVRGVLLLRFAPNLKKELAGQFGDDDLKFLEGLTGKEGAGVNAALLAELITALIEMNRAPMPAIPLELALYRAFEQS